MALCYAFRHGQFLLVFHTHLPPELLTWIQRKCKQTFWFELRRNLCRIAALINQAKQLLLLAQKLGEGVCPWQETYMGEVYIYNPGRREKERKDKSSLQALKKSDHCCQTLQVQLFFFYYYFLNSGIFSISAILPSLREQEELLLWAVLSYCFSW